MAGVAAAAMAGLAAEGMGDSAAEAMWDLAVTARWAAIAWVAASVVLTLAMRAAVLPAARTLGEADTADSGRVAFVEIAMGTATDSGTGGDMGILIMAILITDIMIRFSTRGGGIRGRRLIRTMRSSSRWPNK